jgi:hypothetical protein
VAGAAVHLQVETPTPSRHPVWPAVTGPQGDFETPVPPDTTAVTVLVLAPGYAARAVRLPVTLGESLEIPLHEHGGTVVVEVPGGGASGVPADPRLDHQGAPFWLYPMGSWAALHGVPPPGPGRWVIPMAELGPYRVCAPGGSPCASGFLRPGEELVLRLPVAPPR